MPSSYILPTGSADVDRLVLLNQTYGPSSEAFLHTTGLSRGLRVLEVGCGSGNMTMWIAEQVGPEGHVTGLDLNPPQVEQARRLAQDYGYKHVEFRVANVMDPGLPAGSFDLAYCRLVLMHLKQPGDALAQMRALVRPGGVVACEELDLSHCFCEPPTDAMRRLLKLNLAMGTHRGHHFHIGSWLHRLFREAGFEHPQCSFAFPAVLKGPHKSLLTLTLQEFSGKLIADGVATSAEVEEVLRGMDVTDADDTTLYAMPLMGQVWARK